MIQMSTKTRRLTLIVALLLSLAALNGCVTRHAARNEADVRVDADEAPSPQIADPLERWNRFWFGFNDVFYMNLAKPFSKVYTTVAPKYVRERVNNAYLNFLFPARFVNALLQLRPDKASRELGRFIINSSFGLGGLYDLAAAKPDMGPQELDFGQTLGVWGVGHGFYLVLPLLGPSSLRDGIGLAADTAMEPTTYIPGTLSVATAIADGAGRVNRIPHTLNIYEELKRSAIEPYTAARDAYAQMRYQMIDEALRSAWVNTSAEPAGKPTGQQ